MELKGFENGNQTLRSIDSTDFVLFDFVIVIAIIVGNSNKFSNLFRELALPRPI